MMPASPSPDAPRLPYIRNLRWWIGGLLFASTVINYIDRQTLALLAPFLTQEHRWTHTDYANLLISFRIAYSVGQTLCGRFIDRVGTKRGLSLSVLWYSIVSMATSLATGFYGFATFRFLLGAGESANWPGAAKAVSEWFPKRERGLAAALFDSGSSIGGAIAPFIVLPIYYRWGWRPAFVIPGFLGFLWLFAWRRGYYLPADHPRISPAERQMILADTTETQLPAERRNSWAGLLKLPQTWGAIAAKTLTDPVWFFIADWFPLYLLAKGIPLKTGLIAFWVPFIGADLGNFFGGWASGYLIKRGWSLGAARKAVVIFGAIGVTLLIPTIFTANLAAIATLFGLATFCYAAFSTIANVLPSDLFTGGSVASVFGFSGTGAGIGTIIAFKLIGYFSDANQSVPGHSFDKVIVVAGLVPLLGMILVLLLVRNTRATKEGLVRPV
ncbi:MAG TPA: MFS transporter [Candidatus Acidoferrum sp.]|nr:MFS transporter [Candidatus Acidoferrum sp.]